MEYETKIFFFFLIGWSFCLHVLFVFSENCYSFLERWVPMGTYLFISFLYCCIRYYNYRKERNNPSNLSFLYSRYYNL